MAKAMVQISEASLGGERREKLVRGRTKNWTNGARDLGTPLHKNCSQRAGGGAEGFRIRQNRMCAVAAAICTIPEPLTQPV